jgi:tetratricopeptide (TPR) repeat protein
MVVDVSELWDFEDPAGSQQRFGEAALGPVRPVMLTQVARALGLQGRFAEGHAVLDGVADEVAGAEVRGGEVRGAEVRGAEVRGGEVAGAEVAVRVALERGRLLRSAGRVEEAEPCFQQAARLADEADLPGLQVDALHMLALVPDSPEAQVHRGIAALRVARASIDPAARRWVPSLLHNIAMAEIDRGELVEAESVLAEALVERHRQGEERAVRDAEEALAEVRAELDRRRP